MQLQSSVWAKKLNDGSISSVCVDSFHKWTRGFFKTVQDGQKESCESLTLWDVHQQPGVYIHRTLTFWLHFNRQTSSPLPQRASENLQHISYMPLAAWMLIKAA